MSDSWDAIRRAEHLGRRRPALLAQLPRQIAVARALSDDRREDVVDDAILFTAFDHTAAIDSEQNLEALFWSATAVRVKRTLEGKRNTVRGRFTQVADTELVELATTADDPDAVVQARYETEILLEFARRLEPLKRAVILKRHDRAGDKVHGYATIARELDQPVKAVRAAMRTVERKLDAFQVVVADRQAFERKLAGLLPAPVLADRAIRPSGWRETLLEWIARPLGHDTTATAAGLAGSGGGRGIATLGVALCLGGSVAGGSYCVITDRGPFRDDAPRRAQAPVRVQAAATPTVTAGKPVADRGGVNPAALAAARARRARQARAAQRRARAERRARAARRAEARRTVAGRSRRSEQATAVTPAAPNAAADGSSEFDPTFQPSAPPEPAPPADSGGLPEFP